MKSIYRTWADLNKYDLQIHRFRVILGRRIQIRRKKFSDHSLGQYRTSHINFLTISPVLSQRGAQNILSQHIRILPKISLEWCIRKLCCLISDGVQSHDYLGPLPASCWPPLVQILKRAIFSRLRFKYRTLLQNFSSVWSSQPLI
jgi:hypothetical protein